MLGVCLVSDDIFDIYPDFIFIIITSNRLMKLHRDAHFRRIPESQQRIIKTHLSYEMLPQGVKDKNVKIIYVNRNPRDAVVSFYNHFRVLEGFSGE